MKTITLEQFRNEPELIARLHAKARRERSVYMYRLAKALVEKLTPHALPGGWLARLG